MGNHDELLPSAVGQTALGKLTSLFAQNNDAAKGRRKGEGGRAGRFTICLIWAILL